MANKHLHVSGSGLALLVDFSCDAVNLRSVIAERIKGVRVDAMLTQKDFASSIGSNYLTYRGYENCRSDVPIVLLVRISKLYRVSMDYLTGLC